MDASNFFVALRDFLTPTPTIQQAENPNGISTTIMVPKGFSVTNEDGPESLKPSHVFRDLADFAKYINDRSHRRPCRHHGLTQAKVHRELVDVVVDVRQAVACFDAFDPLAPTVSCELPDHPDWAVWKAHFNKSLTVKQLHTLMRSIPDTLPALGEGPTQAALLRSNLQVLNVKTESGFEQRMNGHGAITLSGQTNKRALEAKIPETLTAIVPIYDGVKVVNDGKILGLCSYELEILVSVELTDNGPRFTLTAPRQPQVERQALADAVKHLRVLLGEDIYVGVGTFDVTSVQLPLSEPPDA
ncbi:MAG: hypothetical protein AAFV53_37905 [Myxococcota bacterium]